jgi:hypothetical protein
MNVQLLRPVQEPFSGQPMDTTDEHSGRLKAELKRRGDLQKCPVCGSQVDPDAYHCPHCRNYYCFHCRARLLASDQQFQCVNQDCDYYGRLLCSVCDPQVEKDEPPAVYAEPEDGCWPFLLITSFVVGALTWLLSSFLAALLISLGGFAGAAYALHRAGVNVFGREREVTQTRSSAFRTCICCEQPVKELRGAS